MLLRLCRPKRWRMVARGLDGPVPSRCVDAHFHVLRGSNPRPGVFPRSRIESSRRDRLHFRDLRTLCGGDTRVTLSLCCCCTGTVLPLHFSVLLLAVVPAAIATAKIASESGQDWIVSMLATGNFTGSILTLVPTRASAGCRSHAHCRCGLFVLGLLIAFPDSVAGACPRIALEPILPALCMTALLARART